MTKLTKTFTLDVNSTQNKKVRSVFPERMQIWNETILERMREFEQNMSTVRYFLGKGREIRYIFGAILYIWCDIHDKDQGLVSYFQLWDIFIAKRGNDIIFLGAIFYVGRLAKWHLLTLADSLTATKDRNQVLHKMQISQRFVKTSKNKSNFWSRPFLYGQVEEFRLGEAMPH